MILGGGCGAQSGSVSAAKAPGVAKDRNASMCFGLGRSAPRLEEIVFALAVTAPLSRCEAAIMHQRLFASR
jgi:hypothetical protein